MELQALDAAVVFAMRMAAVFVMTTAALGRRHGFLPVWFTIASYVIGVVLLIGPVVSKHLILVMPMWVLVLGVLLLARSKSAPQDLFGAESIPPEPLT